MQLALIIPVSGDGLGLRPDNSLPGGPVRPDNSLPGSPAMPEHPIVLPPGQAWPPGVTHPIVPPDPPPGTVWPPLPPGGSGKALVVVWISGVGKRYAVIDLTPTVSPT